MPPSKKFTHSLKVPLTNFEHFLLEKLQKTTGESMADQVRKAIVVYASQAKELNGWISSAIQELKTGQSDADTRILDQQAATFDGLCRQHRDREAAWRRDEAHRLASPYEVPTGSGIVPAIKQVKSGPDTFPGEDE